MGKRAGCVRHCSEVRIALSFSQQCIGVRQSWTESFAKAPTRSRFRSLLSLSLSLSTPDANRKSYNTRFLPLCYKVLMRRLDHYSRIKAHHLVHERRIVNLGKRSIEPIVAISIDVHPLRLVVKVIVSTVAVGIKAHLLLLDLRTNEGAGQQALFSAVLSRRMRGRT